MRQLVSCPLPNFLQACPSALRSQLYRQIVAPRVEALSAAHKQRHAARVKAFHEALREAGMGLDSTWERLRQHVRDDPRAEALTTEQREVAFKELLSTMQVGGQVLCGFGAVQTVCKKSGLAVLWKTIAELRRFTRR